MPLKFRAPYIPRYFPYSRRPLAARTGPAPRSRGAVGAGGIDTTPTGNVGVDLVKAINATMIQNRQNALANQILNTQAPPRAAWVGGTPPPAGVSTTGTAPATGGVGELQMRQQVEQQNLADQAQRAKVAKALLATKGQVPAGGSRSAWFSRQQPQGRTAPAGAKPTKPQPYQPGSGDPQDPVNDDFTRIRADFDNQHGKGAFDTYMRNFGNVTDDGKGNLVLQDDKGNVKFAIPKADAPQWIQRVNAARTKNGQAPLGTPDTPGQDPNSTQAAGSQANPFMPKTPLEMRSLPTGSYIVDPTSGQTVLKRATQGGGTQPQQLTQPAQGEQPTSDQADQAAAEQQLETQEDQDQATAAPQDQGAIAQAAPPVQALPQDAGNSYLPQQGPDMTGGTLAQASDLYPPQDLYS